MTKVYEYISEEQLKDYDFTVYVAASVNKNFGGTAFEIYQKNLHVQTHGQSHYTPLDSEVIKYSTFTTALSYLEGFHQAILEDEKIPYFPPKVAVVSSLELQMKQIVGEMAVRTNSTEKLPVIEMIRENLKNLRVDFFHVYSELGRKRKQDCPRLENVANLANKERDERVADYKKYVESLNNDKKN